MITMKREFSLAVQSQLGFHPALTALRHALAREGFRVVAEIPFHRELERTVGVGWRNYTVLVVWSPFHAYQALLSDRDGGLLVPFNLVVAEDETATFIAATNHALLARIGPVGVQILAQDLTSKLRQILLTLAVQEAAPVRQERKQAQKEAP